MMQTRAVLVPLRDVSAMQITELQLHIAQCHRSTDNITPDVLLPFLKAPVCLQIEMYVGLRDGEHVTFPIGGLGINSNAGTLVLTLPFHPIQQQDQHSSSTLAVWYVIHTSNVAGFAWLHIMPLRIAHELHACLFCSN